MSLIKRCQRQTMVYWLQLDSDSHGAPVWGAPNECTCRWDDKQQELQAADGTDFRSRVEVITQIPIPVGSVICLGKLSEITYWNDPMKNPGAFEVMRSAATPNIRNTEALYEAWAS